MRNSGVARNTVALFGVQVANMVIPLVTLPYLLRVLGPTQFGVVAFCQAVMAVGVVLTDYGFNLSATQRIAQAQGKHQLVSQIFWAVQAAKLGLATVALTTVALLASVVPQMHDVWPVLLACSPVVLGSVLFPQWLFQGLERMGFVTLCIVLARTASVPLIFWLVDSHQDTWKVAFIQSTVMVVAGLLALGLIWHRRLVMWHRPQWVEVSQTLREGWHLFISMASISLYTTANPIIIGLVSNHTTVGLFGAADKIRHAVQGLVSPFSTAVYPRISAVMHQDPHAGLALVRKVLLFQGGLTLGISCCLWAFAPLAVQLIMGEDFSEAVSVLRILAPLPFLIGLSNVFGIQTMLPLGMKAPFSRIVMASGLINMVLLCVLVPLWGADGAAGALLLSELVVTCAMALVLRSADIHLIHNQRIRPV